MKYITKFETTAAYTAAESGLILPNVSLTLDNNAVHYNPSSPTPPTPTETRQVAKYNVTDTSSETQLCHNTDNFSAMEIDGVEQAEVVTYYQFNTIGEHTVKYTLTDLTSIEYTAFQGCTSLTSIDIPSGVTDIGSAAFSSCVGLTSVTIPDSVTTINNESFGYCDALTSINIPNSVTSIGWAAFACMDGN